MNEEEKKAIELLEESDWLYLDFPETECSKYEDAANRIISDYKRVLKENEEYKKQYFCLIDKIENKIDKFDYEFEKAKRKNDNDRANYYWDLIRNLKKLLESEE